MIFDTHCHLFDESFQKDFDAMIKRARKNGVQKFLILGDNLKNSLATVEMIKKDPDFYGAVGIFPCECHGCDLEKTLSEIEKLLSDKAIKAIGEIGLDHHWEKDPGQLKEQEMFFIEQIKLANRYHLPISIHGRDACESIYRILKEYRPEKGAILHCYSFSCEMIEPFLQLGCFISLGGPVTFKNAITPKEVAKKVPLDRLLVETDSPYLAPVPYRGKRNEPAYIIEIVREIAHLRNMDEKEIEKTLFDNACRFFGVSES